MTNEQKVPNNQGRWGGILTLKGVVPRKPKEEPKEKKNEVDN